MKIKAVLFVIGLVAGALAVAVETGSRFLMAGGGRPPGLGVSYLALVDAFLLFVLALQGSSLVVSQQVAAKAQGIITLIVSLLWVIGSLVLALVALALLFLMIGLLLAVPFGTIVYLAKWGSFPVAASAAMLGLILLLKLIWGVALVVANPRFLAVKSLVVLFLLSLLMQVVLSFLHELLPGPIVSIGDALWAVVTAVVALVWALITLIAAIPAIVKAVHSTARVS